MQDRIQKLIDKYCSGNPELHHVLVDHSRSVSDKALRLLDKHPELSADHAFIQNAAMLHDIGIVKTYAPTIFCFGTEPYICHGILGANIVTDEGLPEFARICSCHTGTGLSKEEIILQNIPLPHQDFMPESIEEQIICFADKFFSKTRLGKEKTPDQVRKSLEKFGSQSVERFNHWCDVFL